MSEETVNITIGPENNVELESVKVILSTIDQYKRKFLLSNKMTVEQFDESMSHLFPTFKENYPTLYKITLQQIDISLAYIMLDKMIAINNGKENMDDVRNDLGEHLAKKYVYPAVGKPQKKDV
jgi:hypothetical protein